ncbi:MAG: hypothetical protein A3B23_00070 [Candidatus Colwellbacteria bacterium RIFCSPLOWO2_01_FULL_48_10]|uniref:50S ribosomal protein L15 n=1 Tax=Candidatus Colwellbacteria bacterium RIFCSPLOWO2_01_FULL_48_10 TaxID=1797690 RepID=A0A1G1Z6A8_9BACT|nr:MAG: hypothetical protein A3B23_00070 [Candidatus Colwellbacteria bacterium RIFCSPLOWO2_01_FULL_48_10]
MQLHELQPVYPNRSRIRIGRGGKRGNTSGRGQKGQKSRAGRRIRPAQRDLIQRMPKLRGVKNKPKGRGKSKKVLKVKQNNPVNSPRYAK